MMVPTLIVTFLAVTAPTPLDQIAPAVERGDLKRITSVLVLQDGKTLYERHFNGTGDDTLNDTRSAMKSVTALAVGIAISDGKIPSVAAPAFAFLADLKPFAHDGPLKAAITIEDLLTMSSALDCNDDVSESPGNEEKMYPQHDWARWAVDLPVAAGYARDASGRGRWSYCTAGVFLLGQILQRATAKPVDQLIADRLLHPLGISRFEWPRSPSGEVMTGGGLRLTTRDLGKLGELVRNGGRWDGRQVVPEAWIRAALTSRRAANPEQDYGYLFWQRSFQTACGRSSTWYMSGNGGNWVMVLPDLHAVVVVTSVSYNTKGMHQQTAKLLQDMVLPALSCPPPKPGG